MQTSSIILLVLFVMTMFLWLLTLLGVTGDARVIIYSPWLAWFAVLFLALFAFDFRRHT